MNTTNDSVFLVSRAFARQMVTAGNGGSIVNISSIAGKLFGANTAAYASSKAAMQAITKVMCRELGPNNIRVNAICPGLIDTARMDDLKGQEGWHALVDRSSLGRAGEPIDIAWMVAFVVLVDAPGSPQHQEAERLEVDPRVGDHLLHHLLVAEHLALRAARSSPLNHHVERLTRVRNGPHAMVDPPAAESGLCHHECLTAIAEHVVEWHAHIGVAHVRVRPLVGTLVLPAEPDIAHDLHTRRLDRHDEHRLLLVRGVLRVCHRHHDEERSKASVRREPLLAVDHPLVTVTDSARGEHLRICAALGLGHREAGVDLAVQERLEVLLLLFRRAVVGENLAVTAVRRLAAEHHRPALGATDDLVEERKLHLAITGTTEVGPKVAGPQTAGTNLRLQRRDHPLANGIAAVVRVLDDEVERLELLADEIVHPIKFRLVLRIRLELVTHRAVLPNVSPSPPDPTPGAP